VQAAKAAGGHDLRTAEPGRAGALSGAPNCKPLKGRGLASKPAAAGDFANRSLAPIWGTPNGIGKASAGAVPESVGSGVSALLKGAFETARDQKLGFETRATPAGTAGSSAMRRFPSERRLAAGREGKPVRTGFGRKVRVFQRQSGFARRGGGGSPEGARLASATAHRTGPEWRRSFGLPAPNRVGRRRQLRRASATRRNRSGFGPNGTSAGNGMAPRRRPDLKTGNRPGHAPDRKPPAQRDAAPAGGPWSWDSGGRWQHRPPSWFRLQVVLGAGWRPRPYGAHAPPAPYLARTQAAHPEEPASLSNRRLEGRTVPVLRDGPSTSLSPSSG
jgi:hypothetical protein